MGKGWAKGLSAKTDERVRRGAEARRGQQHVRRKPLEECKWRFAGHTKLALTWSDEMAYVVGLTATDGCLFTGVRKLNFKSQDRDLVGVYLRLLGRTNRIKEELTRTGNILYFTEFHDSRLYEWFRTVGLTPRKSLTLGALDVSDAHLAHLVRGLLDGDGSILNFTYKGTGKAHGLYEDLRTVFNSASQSHVDWLRERLRSTLGIWGSVGSHRPSSRRHEMHRLVYAKRESHQLLAWMYFAADLPCLERKRDVWITYLSRHPEVECVSRPGGVTR